MKGVFQPGAPCLEVRKEDLLQDPGRAKGKEGGRLSIGVTVSLLLILSAPRSVSGDTQVFSKRTV